jgi:hypothetical protein
MSLFFRKRRVRVHFNPIPGVEVNDFEGVLVGRVNGHYLILAPKLLQDANSSYSLDGAVEIPADRVWWLERLAT